MNRIAQIAGGLVAVFVGVIGIIYVVNPSGPAAAAGFIFEGIFGLTNSRTLGAPLLMIALLTALGSVRQNWQFLMPAALYFLFTAIIRVIGLVVDGFDPGTLRGLILAIVLFAVAEFSLQVFKRGEKKSA